jgi:hypothetical protein
MRLNTFSCAEIRHVCADRSELAPACVAVLPAGPAEVGHRPPSHREQEPDVVITLSLSPLRAIACRHRRYARAPGRFGRPSRSSGAAHPSFGRACRTFGSAYPSFGSAYPSFGTAYPSFGTAYRSSGTAYRSFVTACPSFGTAHPSFGTACRGLLPASRGFDLANRSLDLPGCDRGRRIRSRHHHSSPKGGNRHEVS